MVFPRNSDTLQVGPAELGHSNESGEGQRSLYLNEINNSGGTRCSKKKKIFFPQDDLIMNDLELEPPYGIIPNYAVCIDMEEQSTFADSSSEFDEVFLENVDAEEPCESVHSFNRECDQTPGSSLATLRPTPKIEDLVENLRTQGRSASAIDSSMRAQINDFQLAQRQRAKKYTFRPYGVVGLFLNLSDIRSDLLWAKDAASRRKASKSFISWEQFEEKRMRGFRRPYFTYSIILADCAIMVFAFHLNAWEVEPLPVNPLIGPRPSTLITLGALQTQLMIRNGSWWRLASAIVLHGGIIHLIINTAVMAFLGRAIERNHGFIYTFILFFVPAVGGNMISATMQPSYILVGASGGIFGLLGVCVADILLNWKLLFLVFESNGVNSSCTVRCCCFFSLVLDLMINSLIGFTPYVDNFAHLGGFAYGFLISLTILERLPLSFFGKGTTSCYRRKMASLRSVGTLAASTLIVISTVLLNRSDGLKSPCTTCRYITCLPFPFWADRKWWYCDGCDAVSGEIFRKKGEAHFSSLDLVCPSGSTIDIDISDFLFIEYSEVEGALPGFCRNYC